jgi:hypothetical protein
MGVELDGAACREVRQAQTSSAENHLVAVPFCLSAPSDPNSHFGIYLFLRAALDGLSPLSRRDDTLHSDLEIINGTT